jgi:hypothetical protein
VNAGDLTSDEHRESTISHHGLRVRSWIILFLLLLAAFSFRLWFGLCSEFRDADTKQIYLLGLKFYTTGQWPYFGPDVVYGWDQPPYDLRIQIPGALQGLLVGLPLFILPIPEAPYILLNVLTFGSLCFFAWYCCKRLPELPKWFVWPWLLTAPWLLNLSTVIYNPSYVLPGGIIFFIGALEIFPFTKRDIIPSHWANFMMGFALCWVMQLHLSWPTLAPYILLAFYFQWRRGVKEFVRGALYFIAGAAITASVLLPTYLNYGLGAGANGSAARFNAANLSSLWGILTRSLSFASFEIPRLLGPHTAERLAFLKQEKWMIPFVAFLFVAGTAQVIALIFMWFKRQHDHADWRAIKYLVAFNILITYLLFLFSLKPPQSNHLYLTAPIPILYSLYCWSWLLKKNYWRTFAKIFIVCGVIFHIGLAIHNRSRTSIYTERQVVESAIEKKDYRILGERRNPFY